MIRDAQAPLRVALIDDQSTIRKALAQLLESDCPAVVVVAGDQSDETIEAFDGQGVQVALVDFDAQMHDPSATVRRAVARNPDLPICALVVQGESHKVLEALAAGCRGAVSSDTSIENLLSALRTIASGEPYVDHALSGELLARGFGPALRHVKNGAPGPRAGQPHQE